MRFIRLTLVPGKVHITTGLSARYAIAFCGRRLRRHGDKWADVKAADLPKLSVCSLCQTWADSINAKKETAQ